MKKYLFLAAVAALMMTSCSSDEVVKESEIKNGAIEFRTLTDKNQTRATVTNGSNILGFTLTAWEKYGKKYLFNAFDVTRGESTTRWIYTPSRYWPSSGTVDFYAYSPASSTHITKGLEQIPSQGPSTGGLEIEYKVPKVGPNESQEDFLVAVSIDKNEGIGTGNLTGVLTLNFQHALSRVLFQAKKPNDDITYIIYGIELMNIYEEGTLKMKKSTVVSPSDGIPESGVFGYGTTPTILWTTKGTRTNYAVDMGDSPVYVLFDKGDKNKYTSVVGETNALMVMPQTTLKGSVYLPADVTSGTVTEAYVPKPNYETDYFYIKVAYKAFSGDGKDRIYYAGNENAPKEMYIPVDDPVRSSEPLSFEIGRQYTFNLRFGHEITGTPIGFDVNVSDWNALTPSVVGH